MKIGTRSIGPGHPAFIVAELSCNHAGDYERAVHLVEAAAEAGADAIKLQLVVPGDLAVDSEHPAHVVPAGPWAGRRLYDLYYEAFTPTAWHITLFARARRAGMAAFTTPYSAFAVGDAVRLNADCIKVSSFELTDLAFLDAVAATGKPVILSTGMASDNEIRAALDVFQGRCPVVLLHCVSAYPTPPEHANLRRITHLRDTFGVPVGLSNHGLDPAIDVAAVTLGVCVIEKHLRLDDDVPTLDREFSLTPTQFAEMVRAVRTAEAGLSTPLGDVETSSRAIRRRLVWTRDLPAGHVVGSEDYRTARTTEGLPPSWEMDGAMVTDNVKQGDPVMPADLRYVP